MDKFNLKIATKRNLLAFSAGVDSTALFFLLVEKNIPFDIAIVNYNQRERSQDESIYATQLAHKYHKKCFLSTYPEGAKFSEKDARDFRYNFFDSIMVENHYESLLTAHQLNDKCEWFLMQFTKGAGLSELIGMEEITHKNGYQILKPLLCYTKNSLLEYLLEHNHKFFEDSSNSDQKYTRNYFRHNFSDKLLQKYQKGILKSFQYLAKDSHSLLQNYTKDERQQLTIYTYNQDLNVAIRIIDQDLKRRGILLSNKTRGEILTKKEVVVSHSIAVAIVNEKIYIAPYLQTKMEKKFKERCRKAKIPPNIRGYLSTLEDFTY